MVLTLKGYRKGSPPITDASPIAGAPAQTAPGYPPVLTRDELTQRIIADAMAAGFELTQDAAGMMVDLWARARADADNADHPARGRRIETLLTRVEWDSIHLAMDTLMPDDTTAEPGTVHDELNRTTFGVGPDGRALRQVVHTMDSFDHCAVCVAVLA